MRPIEIRYRLGGWGCHWTGCISIGGPEFPRWSSHKHIAFCSDARSWRKHWALEAQPLLVTRCKVLGRLLSIKQRTEMPWWTSAYLTIMSIRFLEFADEGGSSCATTHSFPGNMYFERSWFQNVFEGHSESTAALTVFQSAIRVLSVTRDMTRWTVGQTRATEQVRRPFSYRIKLPTYRREQLGWHARGQHLNRHIGTSHPLKICAEFL